MPLVWVRGRRQRPGRLRGGHRRRSVDDLLEAEPATCHRRRRRGRNPSGRGLRHRAHRGGRGPRLRDARRRAGATEHCGPPGPPRCAASARRAQPVSGGAVVELPDSGAAARPDARVAGRTGGPGRHPREREAATRRRRPWLQPSGRGAVGSRELCQRGHLIFSNNCANFASHALLEAGLQEKGWNTLQDDAWGRSLAGDWHVPWISGVSHTETWYNSDLQRQFFLDNGGSQIQPQDARPGDIVYFDWADGEGGNPDGVSHHTAVITAVLPDGEILYTQHTPGRVNQSLQDRLPVASSMRAGRGSRSCGQGRAGGNLLRTPGPIGGGLPGLGRGWRGIVDSVRRPPGLAGEHACDRLPTRLAVARGHDRGMGGRRTRGSGGGVLRRGHRDHLGRDTAHDEPGGWRAGAVRGGTAGAGDGADPGRHSAYQH